MTNTVNNEGLGTFLYAFIVSLLLMFLAGAGYAQESVAAKAADATEVASVGKEVKSVIVVPTELVKAMMTGKVEVGKAGKKSAKKAKMKNVQTDQRWFPVNANPSFPNDPIRATVSGSPSTALPSPSSCNTTFSGPMCNVRVDVEGIDDTELTAILNNIANNTQSYTIQDLIDAGASVTVVEAWTFDPDVD